MPTGFVPAEDSAFVMMDITLPEGISQTETKKISEEMGNWLKEQPGVEQAMNIVGYGILAGGQKSNAAAAFIGLTDWDQRTTKDLSVNALIGKIIARGAQIPQASIIALNPPPIDGMGTSSGFSMQLEDAAAIRRLNCRKRHRSHRRCPPTSGNRFGLHGFCR